MPANYQDTCSASAVACSAVLWAPRASKRVFALQAPHVEHMRTRTSCAVSRNHSTALSTPQHSTALITQVSRGQTGSSANILTLLAGHTWTSITSHLAYHAFAPVPIA